jgi:hypothetical protein
VKPIPLEKAVRDVSSTLGISRSTARNKIVILCEMNDFFAKGFSTDIANFKHGKKAVLSCLRQLVDEDNRFVRKKDMYNEVSKRMCINPQTAKIKLLDLEKFDPEIAQLLNSLQETKMVVPRDAAVQELNRLLEEKRTFRSMHALHRYILLVFKVKESTKNLNNIAWFFRQISELSSLAKMLVVPPATRVAVPEDFRFAEKMEYPPQYVLGLLENGALWFHMQKQYTIPRPMFTMASSSRGALDLLAGYFESGNVTQIGQGQFRLRFSGFGGCIKLRVFLEQNQPVNLAAHFQEWLSLWDSIISNKGKANCGIWQKVPQVTSQLQAQNVVLTKKLPLQWIVGFLDGSIGRFLDARMDGKYVVARALFHSTSKQLLDAMRETLSVGTVTELKSNPGKFRYFVSRPETKMLAEALDNFPPILRHERFILWKEIAKLARENNQPYGADLVRANALLEKLNTEKVVRHKV